MSDIVERLRAVAAMDLRTGGFLAHTLDTAKEAADEIERLRAPPTEAEVEAAAKAIFHTEYDRDEYQWAPTGAVYENEVAIYRKMARAALEAATKVREE